ncbi:hypothetical protein [Streptomyces sp. NPDC020747]|uniref:hypothetical protein n=1 Tax=Streptomyces sp. NPDC020747 TaxID=3365086 RepID=UPI0037B40435
MFKRTAVYVRGKTRSRRRKATFVALFAFVVAVVFAPLLTVTPAQAVTITECPGGTYSGQAGAKCPNLRNKNLNNQRAFPRDLYRGDSRSPAEIFERGFFARGTNSNLVSHVQGDRAGNSNYISTSGSLSLAETFAKSQGMRNLDSAIRQPGCSQGRMKLYSYVPFVGNFLLASCVNDIVTAYSYVYVINPTVAKNALYVPEQIRGNKALYNQYKSQDEWAYVRKIKREGIAGVRIYKMTARVDRAGRMMLQTLTFNYVRYAGNVYNAETLAAMQNYHPYDPINDPIAQWNFYTDLHTPTVSASDFNRLCTSITRCRGASSSSPPRSSNSISVADIVLGRAGGSGMN